MATLPPATTLLTPLVLVTSPRGRLRLMPTTDLTATADSVLTAMEATVLATELFLPLAPLPLLEPMPPLPPLPPSPFVATAPPPPSEPTSLTATPPPEFPLCLLLASPCRATLRATATATATTTNRQ